MADGLAATHNAPRHKQREGAVTTAMAANADSGGDRPSFMRDYSPGLQPDLTWSGYSLPPSYALATVKACDELVHEGKAGGERCKDGRQRSACPEARHSSAL